MANIHLFNDMSIGGIEREYIEVFKPSIGEVKTEFKPTDIVHIDGNRYRLVNRKAEVGEKVLIVNDECSPEHDGLVGVVEFSYSCAVSVDIGETIDYFPYIGDSEYRVLESVVDDNPTVDGRHASPEVIDLLANLARRVTSLEQQLADTQGNVEKLAEEIASVKHLAESNEGDIAMLDERTVVINTSNITVNKDADIDAIARALSKRLEAGGAFR